jgi:hypothetical protein
MFLIRKLYGSLFSDDILIEAKNKQKAIRKFCEQEKIQYKEIRYSWESYKKQKAISGQILSISIQPIKIKDGKKYFVYSAKGKQLPLGYYNIII